MAHQVQFRNSIIFCLAAMILIASCTLSTKPLERVNRNNNGFVLNAGQLFYKNEPFTGISFELYDKGDTSRTITYKDGKEDGFTKCYYPNKQIAQLRFFKDGKKQGIHRGWWPDGSAKFEYHFTDDEYNGELKEWYNDGKPFRFFHYAMGHEQGSEKMWWEDGKIRANYVIVNGEKFGLFGQKICTNKAESIN